MLSSVRFSIVLLRWLACMLALAVPLAGAMALDIREGPKAVVELFTSQGCSSCPEADRFLARLGERADMVTLAYHVDYWDYIGWEDTFALPANGTLQRAYAQAWGKGRIFTPQIVLNGAHGIAGTQSGEVTEKLETLALPLPLSVAAREDSVIELSAQGKSGFGDAIVWLVTFRNTAEVNVERGENSGRALTYTHIVTNRQAIGMWSPQDGFSMRVPLSEIMGDQSDGAAILIQEKHGELPGPIIGAAMVLR